MRFRRGPAVKIEQKGRYTHVIIAPGEYYATTGPALISTLLGSCVAACLYDHRRNIIGMNHFMLSDRRSSKELPLYASEAGRYGVHAMELLINDMMRKGADRRALRAKVFGGASIFMKDERVENFVCVGLVNCEFIREFLAAENIPVDAEDLGGKHGRVIHFSNGDFTVYHRKIDGKRSHKIAARDRLCWQQAIRIQESLMPEVELW